MGTPIVTPSNGLKPKENASYNSSIVIEVIRAVFIYFFFYEEIIKTVFIFIFL